MMLSLSGASAVFGKSVMMSMRMRRESEILDEEARRKNVV